MLNKINDINLEEETVKIEETERYIFLMEESQKMYPECCLFMLHIAVCSQIMEENGIEYDENDVENYNNLYCKKLEYNNMISKIEEKE